MLSAEVFMFATTILRKSIWRYLIMVQSEYRRRRKGKQGLQDFRCFSAGKMNSVADIAL